MKAGSMATSKGSAAAAGVQIGAVSDTASDAAVNSFTSKCFMAVIRVSLPSRGLSGLAPSDLPTGPTTRPNQSPLHNPHSLPPPPKTRPTQPRWQNPGAVRPERKPAIVRAHLHPPKDPKGPKDPQAGIN